MKNAVLRFLNKAIIAYIEMKNAPRRGGCRGGFYDGPLADRKRAAVFLRIHVYNSGGPGKFTRQTGKLGFLREAS